MKNKIILIYDGNCPLCREARNWLSRHDRDNVFTTVACQSANEHCRLDETSAARCQRAMCLLFPDGSMYSGIDALPHVLRRIKGWKWVARLITLPVIKWLARGVYFLVSRNRFLLSRLWNLPYDDACCSAAKQDSP